MKLFPTNSNLDLAQKISSQFKIPLGKRTLQRFADGEVFVKLEENVENQKVYVLGSTFPPAENFLELTLLINTLKVNGATQVTTLIPYFGYGKQDRIDRPGAALSAKLMVQFLETAGSDRIICVNLHSPLVENFFKVPLTHLNVFPFLARKIEKEIDLSNSVVVSPDEGGLQRAKSFAQTLNISEIMVIQKAHPKVNESQIVSFKGHPQGKHAIIVDDFTQTGGTLLNAIKILKENGALSVSCVLAHLIPTGPAFDNLQKDDNLQKIYLTDTIPFARKSSKVKIISIIPLFEPIFQKP
jgi:ribose-phosphate pyrophosphokinase